MRCGGQVYVGLANLPASLKHGRLEEREETGGWEKKVVL